MYNHSENLNLHESAVIFKQCEQQKWIKESLGKIRIFSVSQEACHESEFAIALQALQTC